jgi:cbb3-type cytochrome oxidase maturation protein
VNIIYFLLPIALLLGLSFAAAFVFSSLRGQFDDLETPAHRLLLDDEIKSDSKKGTTT